MAKPNYVEFTKEMKKDYTILLPMMLPVHFKIIEQILKGAGYHVELLETSGRQIVEEGLKNVHNDTCYPALLVIGQMIDALKSGKYDPKKTALMITQTGGGCRASNYIFLLRKALEDSEFKDVPVISLNFMGLEKSSGFKLNPKMLIDAMFALIYGDLIMWISNQCKPYEKRKGDTQKVIDKWVKELCDQFHSLKFLRVSKNYQSILKDFAAIPRTDTQKIRVGIVGEIYMKYAPLGNNHLEDFLIQEGAEPVVSGVLDFLLYCIENVMVDKKLYGKGNVPKFVASIGLKILNRWQNQMIKQVKKHGVFRAPSSFSDVVNAADGFINKGTKMGEGWLLTSEMLELIHSGVDNIVCTQPFGCLPNHIVAKGMMRKIKTVYPEANIVAIDYDPSATPINQINRLKLMLSNAQLTQEMHQEEVANESQKSKVSLPHKGHISLNNSRQGVSV